MAIARALVNDPKIILADEPTGNLDAANEQIVLDLLTDLHAQGRTILMVTHDEHVGRCADRRINLEHGRIVETISLQHGGESGFRRGAGAAVDAPGERRRTTKRTHFTDAQHRRLFATMTRIGLLRVEAGKAVEFTRPRATPARAA